MQGTIRIHVSFGVWRLILSAHLLALDANCIKAELRCTDLPLGLLAEDMDDLLREPEELFAQIESQDEQAPIPTCRCKLRELDRLRDSIRFDLQPLSNFDEIQDLLGWHEMPSAT